MTASNSPSISSQSLKAAHKQDPDTFFRLLDRALATRYVKDIRDKEQRRKGSSQYPRLYKPRMDLWDNQSSPSIIAMLELPGLKKDEVMLRIHQNNLFVWGERKSRLVPSSTDTQGKGKTKEPKDEDSPMDVDSNTPTSVSLPVQELKYGKFSRVIPLPKGIQTNEISASMTDGILTITWPRKPRHAPPTASPSPAASTAGDTAPSPKSGSQTGQPPRAVSPRQRLRSAVVA